MDFFSPHHHKLPTQPCVRALYDLCVLVFPIKALEICMYIEIEYDAHEPQASLRYCYPGKNTMILHSICMTVVLFYVNSVKPAIFLLTLSAYVSASIYLP